MFRAADVIKHAPTGEDWSLACDEQDGRVLPCGWPQTMAEAKVCTLVEAATDAERADMLQRWATKGGSDLRVSWAKHQLATP